MDAELNFWGDEEVEVYKIYLFFFVFEHDSLLFSLNHFPMYYCLVLLCWKNKRPTMASRS